MGKFLLIFLMMAGANAFAEVNKWVDGQGRVHYSDQAPPPEVQAEALRSASEGAGSASGVAPTYVQQEASLKRAQQMDAAQAAAKQAAADAMKANCEAAQKNLLSLQSGVRMMDINASGERYFIDDAERQQRIEKVRQDISNYCK
jgi:hypothetical protein